MMEGASRTVWFGIIVGVKGTCWECQQETENLAWYDSGGVNQVCQPCIRKIFAEAGLDWDELKPVGFSEDSPA